ESALSWGTASILRPFNDAYESARTGGGVKLRRTLLALRAQANAHRVTFHLIDAQHGGALAFAFGYRSVDLMRSLRRVEFLRAGLDDLVCVFDGPFIAGEGDGHSLDLLLRHFVSVGLMGHELPNSLDLTQGLLG